MTVHLCYGYLYGKTLKCVLFWWCSFSNILALGELGEFGHVNHILVNSCVLSSAMSTDASTFLF